MLEVELYLRQVYSFLIKWVGAIRGLLLKPKDHSLK
ncbi:hypothetical protein E5S67_00755 [Microcoleus sp. IPMA8]|uniref:Uncharacterized protein n=1 Tax=Microcoleus asticus IPMA8 TaxID=2563858 RepID=A0ABX2CSE7_9CYAN|nr:hypothetical protein [Microcoleus asticus IPMA8]